MVCEWLGEGLRRHQVSKANVLGRNDCVLLHGVGDIESVRADRHPAPGISKILRRDTCRLIGEGDR